MHITIMQTIKLNTIPTIYNLSLIYQTIYHLLQTTNVLALVSVEVVPFHILYCVWVGTAIKSQIYTGHRWCRDLTVDRNQDLIDDSKLDRSPVKFV